MILFRVDMKTMIIMVFTDPTAKINNSSVYLNGKRRDRITDTYEWYDDEKEAFAAQERAISRKRAEVNSQILELNNILANLVELPIRTKKIINKAIADYNNDSFFD